MNTLTLQATFCGLLHGLGKLAFRADKTAADLLAALPDTPEWAAVRGGAAAGSDAARCAAFARSLSVTADTPAAEPASSRCRPLRSIFSHLNGEHPGYSVPAARPDGALHDPVQDAPDIPAAVYRELYQELTGQLTGLQFSPAQANALLGLLESQCSGLPASTARDEDRDISLYDQLKLTAALAACVSEYLQQADTFSLLDTPAELRREPAFLLYTADFSRIQRFIYTVHTEGALRSLRSRSFFLELLMEHYMDELLDGCGLTRTNIIYSGGGHCYLLLPSTAAVQLEAMEARIVEPRAGRMVPNLPKEGREGANWTAIHANPLGTSRIACTKSNPTYVPDSAPSATATTATAACIFMLRCERNANASPQPAHAKARTSENRAPACLSASLRSALT